MKTNDIAIRPLRSVEEMQQAEELQSLIWPDSEVEILPSHLLLNLAYNGCVVLGAFDREAMVGFVVSFLGTDPLSSDRVAMARLKHCSHALIVHPHYRNRRIGYQLKLAQRAAVMKDGIRLITWTYDPLSSAHAHLNIRLLGSVCRIYLRDMYDKLHANMSVDPATDRFQVDWWITSSRVDTHVDNQRSPLDLANYLDAGAQKLNPSLLNEQDFTVPSDRWFTPEGNLLLVEIPANYSDITQQDVELARAWRMHTREIFEGVFAAGYMVTDFIHLKGEKIPRSYYVLSYGESRLG